MEEPYPFPFPCADEPHQRQVVPPIGGIFQIPPPCPALIGYCLLIPSALLHFLRSLCQLRIAGKGGIV